ncbi:Malic enzyme [Aphelenchoides bicaudatus]|nr:Malic enzyme [Aphelenchoides bicaudatus]
MEKCTSQDKGNNAYIFPGVALGIILFQINHIDSRHFLLAARVVADYVTEHNLSHGRIYPRIQEIRNLSIQIAKTIAEECYKDGTATLYPEPEHKEMYIRSQIYSVEYEQIISTPYDWPNEDMFNQLRSFNTTMKLDQTPDPKKLNDFNRRENVSTSVHGAQVLRVPDLNKGMSFNLQERQQLGIHGLLPPSFRTIEQESQRTVAFLRQLPNDISRFMFLGQFTRARRKTLLSRLGQQHKRVFADCVHSDCWRSLSELWFYLSNWPRKDVRAIVVTDGERILGLGDLGVQGMGISVGKLALYVALGGVRPEWCLPITLDVGTNNEKLSNDPYYIGLRQKRVRGEKYDEFVDNFMAACVKRFGQNTLIQFEDFGNANAYRLLDKYQPQYCMFNDDIQGTAAVVVAGLLSCARVLNRKMSETRYLFFGGGTAAIGIIEMCLEQMESEGFSKKEAFNQIFVVNSKGLVTKKTENLNPRLVDYIKDVEPIKDLAEIVRFVRPHAIIGTSTVGGSFTEDVIKSMSENTERPIIFPLSNPTKNSECSAEQAYEWTTGKALFAAGSPFDNVTFNGNLYKPGQGNNAYIFPGVALGIILFKISHIDSRHFLLAARVVAEYAKEHSFKLNRIYPRLKEIRELSVKIAKTIAEECYKDKTAGLYPEPVDKEAYIRSQVYNVNYDNILGQQYEWPKEATQPLPYVEPLKSLDELDD